MKKIVALVLSLVMVLGLATTAFAATTTVYNDKDCSLTTADGTLYEYADADVTKYEKATSTTTVDGKTVTTITPAYYVVSISSKKMVEVDKSLADYMLKIEDVGSVYVAEMVDVPTVNAADVATAYTAPELAACGVVGSDYQAFYIVDGKYYAADADGAKTALVNGNYVRMAATKTDAKGHDWLNATAKSYDAKTSDITSVECDDCDAVVNVYETAGTFDGKTYVKITEGVAANYYFVDGEAANTPVATTPSTDKVESAETFDAGIAMYVGMSVMAAAGSAVVLKKKD